MTSPFSALRLSGRLMVIQNACPRFSRMTLWCRSWSTRLVSPNAGRHLRQVRRWTASAKSALALTGWRRLPDPDLVVVEGSAADRRDRIGASQRVDAAAADMISCWDEPIRRSARRGARRRTVLRPAWSRPGCCRASRRRRRRCRARPHRADGSSRAALPSRACEDGVSLKVVLRKLREGLVASRNGCAVSASSITAQWSGSDGILSMSPIG